MLKWLKLLEFDKRADLETGASRKQSTSNFLKHRVRNVRFSENLACLVFLKHLFEIRPFALLPTSYCFRKDPL